MQLTEEHLEVGGRTNLGCSLKSSVIIKLEMFMRYIWCFTSEQYMNSESVYIDDNEMYGMRGSWVA